MALELVSKTRCFGGIQKVFRHSSTELKCSMKFSVYEPELRTEAEKFNVLIFLSGLTCTEENFIQKSGFQKYANEHRLLVVGPDTSPRGLGLPGEKDLGWDFGEGAGFYVDAVQKPWSEHYRMYSYVVSELVNLIKTNFPVTQKFGITGHSMGGHGALVCGLRNPDIFSSISAFAPICNPSNSPWGRDKTFKYYLGDDNKDLWASYDSTDLSKSYSGPLRKILVDQGGDDDFLNTHLMPNALKDAASGNTNIELDLRLQEGYNHSYFFIATFIEDHIKHHAEILKGDTQKA